MADLKVRMSKITRLVAGRALALSACLAHPAQGVAAGDAIAVDVAGRDRDVVRLVDATTRATIASDRVQGEPVQEQLVSPDRTVVAIRRGARDGGDSLSVYAIAWAVDPASGAKAAKVAHVLNYRPRDGHLGVSLRQVPNGVVLQVQTGRHPPLWRKVFLYERASGTWYEWARALAPQDPTNGMPTTVGVMDPGEPYAAWLGPLDPRGD